MRVQDIMTVAPISVPRTTALSAARDSMREQRIRHLLVMEGERLVGVVTDRDIRLNSASPATSLSVWELTFLLDRLTVGDIMTAPAITIRASEDIAEAARVMIQHRIGCLPVVAGGEIVGSVTETDLLSVVANLEEFERLELA
jgi:acetoin utilization protein AcuB